jgi:hypothetical protein
MALNGSGPISLGGSTQGQSIAVELGLSPTAAISLNQTNVRTLAGVASGAIVMPTNFYGKSNEFTFTISTNTTNANLRTLAIAAGWNQTTKVIATVGSGVYVYSTSTGTPGLTINGSWPNGIFLVNNGFIIGMGGGGGGDAGGNAISLGVSCTITNNSYIAGGGGGGASNQSFFYEGQATAGGGGGAVGGDGGGSSWNNNQIGQSAQGGAGGLPGQPGQSGESFSFGYNNDLNVTGGGGGGRILTASSNGDAGSASFAGSASAGGTWGSSAGDGGAGGKAVALNGFTATFLVNGNRFGAIS